MEKIIFESLEKIGLTKSEVKVYTALSKIGPSSTGQIVKISKTANSKIYEVLRKLIEKGLVSYFSKNGVKMYKSSNPSMILEYLKEKEKGLNEQKKEISKIMPFLIQKNKEISSEETVVYKGERGVKTGFLEFLSQLNKNDELHIMGVHEFGKNFLPLSIFFQKNRSNKKIKAKFLINEGAENIVKEFKQFPPLEIKYLKKEILTPSIFIISKEEVIINLPNELTLIILKSKDVVQSFKSYFEILWGQSKKSVSRSQ